MHRIRVRHAITTPVFSYFRKETKTVFACILSTKVFNKLQEIKINEAYAKLVKTNKLDFMHS